MPTPAASNPNDGETLESWTARRDRLLAQGINGNGMGTPLGIAVQLLPTPIARDGRGTSPHIADPAGRPLDEVVGLLLPTPVAKLGDPRRGSPSASVATGRWASGRRNLDDAAALPPTPRATDGTKGGPNQHGSSGDLMLPSAVQPGRWGRWAAAITRWETVLGRPAPDPTEPGSKGQPRLSPRFVEWLMGTDAGTVTAVPGVSRAGQLARLGNGVVPQQAAAAVRLLLGGPA